MGAQKLSAGVEGTNDQMDEVNFSDSEIAYHIREALKSVVSGDTDAYDQIIGVLHHKKNLVPDDVALLVTTLKALAGAVSYINFKQHQSLVISLCKLSLWDFSPDVMDAQIELVISMASSSGEHFDLCLDMLLNNFLPPYSFLEILKQPRGLAKKDQVLSRVHRALKDLAKLVPLAPLRLEQRIRERMPKVFDAEATIVIYMENMLKLESGVLGELIGSSMLLELINRLIELDVEIGWDEILLDDPSKGIFEMELEDMERPIDATDIDELPREYSGRKVLWGNVVAEKLDSLMLITFQHLESCCTSGRLVQVFETLLQSFQSTVLTTYKSKFTQFVIFYACSLDPVNCGDQFVARLLDIFTSKSNPRAWRMSAIAYLASYLSRASFLSAEYVTVVVKSMVNWCSNYCKSQREEVNPKAHQVFYAGCQAIMYVLCFHLRSILGSLRSELLSMPIEEILKHPLKPLEVCLPSIVHEFLRQAKAAHLFHVSGTFVFHDLLESEFSRAFGGLERLDMFFPFDPYLLKKSDRYIKPIFRYWSMVRTTYEDGDGVEDDDDSSDEDQLGEDHVINGPTAMSYDENYLDDFDASLNKMSITPHDSWSRIGGESNGRMKMPSRIRPSMSPESP